MTVYDTTCHKQVSDWLKPNPTLGNSFMKMHLNMSSHVLRNGGDFVQVEMSQVYSAAHIPSRGIAVCRAWTSMEQSMHHFDRSLRWSLLIHTDRATPPWWLQMPWRQIGARLSATTVLMWLWLYCMSRASYYIHWTNNVRERSRGRPPASFFVIDGFALWPR